MGSALVAAGGKEREALAALVRECGYSPAATAPSGGDARRMLARASYELVFISAPLPDEFGADLALHAAQTSDAGVMLLVRAELADEVSARVEDAGVFVLGRPLPRELLHRAVKLVASARRRMLGMRLENVRLQTKLEEIRLVGRAKCALIQYLGMTEEQAHRYIEKQAMDLRVTRREVARDILKVYESNWVS